VSNLDQVISVITVCHLQKPPPQKIRKEAQVKHLVYDTVYNSSAESNKEESNEVPSDPKIPVKHG
jgi:hypothetical protein